MRIYWPTSEKEGESFPSFLPDTQAGSESIFDPDLQIFTAAHFKMVLWPDPSPTEPPDIELGLNLVTVSSTTDNAGNLLPQVEIPWEVK